MLTIQVALEDKGFRWLSGRIAHRGTGQPRNLSPMIEKKTLAILFPSILGSISSHPATKMVTALLLLSALAGFFSVAKGQAFHLGKCPTPPVQENFDVNKVW